MTDAVAAVEEAWRRESSRLVGALLRITRSLDRAEDLAQDALAQALATWPEAGLAVVDDLATVPALRTYHLLPSVRGELLEQLGRRSEAAAEFRRSAELADNAAEQRLLTDRAARLEQDLG